MFQSLLLSKLLSLQIDNGVLSRNLAFELMLQVQYLLVTQAALVNVYSHIHAHAQQDKEQNLEVEECRREDGDLVARCRFGMTCQADGDGVRTEGERADADGLTVSRRAEVAIVYLV